MIYVVEGNFQKAYLELKALKETGEKLTLIKHSRTFGEAIAIHSGFLHASGGDHHDAPGVSPGRCDGTAEAGRQPGRVTTW